MIVVTGSLTIKPENRDEVLQILASTSAATREEPGCVDYRFGVDVGDENRMMLCEQWESEEAMATHVASPGLAEFMGKIGGFLAGAEVIRHDVSESKPLF